MLADRIVQALCVVAAIASIVVGASYGEVGKGLFFATVFAALAMCLPSIPSHRERGGNGF
jgi:hypothetical protein